MVIDSVWSHCWNVNIFLQELDQLLTLTSLRYWLCPQNYFKTFKVHLRDGMKISLLLTSADAPKSNVSAVTSEMSVHYMIVILIIQSD